MAARGERLAIRLSKLVMAAAASGGLAMAIKTGNASEPAEEICAEVARELVAEKFASVAGRMSAAIAACLPPPVLAETWRSSSRSSALATAWANLAARQRKAWSPCACQ